MERTPSETYQDFMKAATDSLAPDEFWCVANDEGVFSACASKDLGEAVRTFCDALDIDWDEAQEDGCRVCKVVRRDSSISNPGEQK